MKSTRYPARPPGQVSHLKRAKGALRLHRKKKDGAENGSDGSISPEASATGTNSVTTAPATRVNTSAREDANGAPLETVDEESNRATTNGKPVNGEAQDVEAAAADGTYEEEEEEEEVPLLTLWTALGLLACVTVVR